MAIAVLLRADGFEGTVEAAVTSAIAVVAIVTGGILVRRHERHHLARLLDEGTC